jgi:plasmid stabilization system protein ParE
MKYQVRVLARANRDLDRIYAWLAKRSPSGATAWYEAALQALNDLRDNADQHGRALEGPASPFVTTRSFLQNNAWQTLPIALPYR